MKNILAASFVFSEMSKNNNLSTQTNDESSKESTTNSNGVLNILFEEYVESNIDSTIHINYINSYNKYQDAKNYILHLLVSSLF